jgi:hypothetical protein
VKGDWWKVIGDSWVGGGFRTVGAIAKIEARLDAAVLQVWQTGKDPLVAAGAMS